MFAALERLGLASRATVASILDNERRAATLRAQAKQLWDSIPAGEVIYKRGVGEEGPVGKNADVQRLHKEANLLEAAVANQKRQIATLEGQALLGTASSSLWQDRQDLANALERLRDSHAWYYRGRWGTILSVVHDLSRLLFIVSCFFALLTFIPALALLTR